MGDKCPACKKGAPLWVLTYGDMMSLLLCFFILLLSFATMSEPKFQSAAGSLKSAFGVQTVKQIMPTPTGETYIPMEFNVEIVLVQLRERIQLLMEKLIDNGEAEVVEEQEGFIVRFFVDANFQEGKFRLRPETEVLLMQIANQLNSVPNLVFVNGHTDNTPVDGSSIYPNNWLLSSVYAAAVAEVLAAKGGVDPTRLQVRGYGEFQPVSTNTTSEGRDRNRRVEVMVSRQTQASYSNPHVKAEVVSEGSSGGGER